MAGYQWWHLLGTLIFFASFSNIRCKTCTTSKKLNKLIPNPKAKIVDSGSLKGISDIIGIKGATLPPVVEIIYVKNKVDNPNIEANSNNNFALFFII